MVSIEKQEELKNAILNRLYEEADPGIDWDDYLENPDEYDDDFYDKNTISREREEEIIAEELKKHDVDKEDLPSGFWLSVITDKSPRYKRSSSPE